MAFIGREKEARLMQQALEKDQATILLYGKRKVGKTTLIKECLKSQPKQFIYFECLRGTMSENLAAFVSELVRLEILPVAMSFQSFLDVFTYLGSIGKPLIVVIDEYPYLKAATKAEFIDSMMQSIIDNRLQNLQLILSGSHIGMMKEMLEEGNALYGRFKMVIHLKELPYHVASRFYPDLRAYDKVGFYSVFGGSPYILGQLDGKQSLRENIIRTILNENSPVYLYASNLLLSDYSNTMNTERIFSVLGNGKKRYSELEDRLDGNKTGNLSKQLSKLIALDIIHRNLPFNHPNDAKKATYEINENLIRFFFTYVYRNRSALQMLGAAAFYDAYVAPSLVEFISRRFEEICRTYFSIQVKAGALPGVRNIGSYYYDNPKERTNGEFDVALDYGDAVAIYEAKYLKQPMEPDEIHHEVSQIEKIPSLTVSRIGFISVNGFAEKEDGYSYLTGEDLFAAE